MDNTMLVQNLSAFLAPFLPYLLKTSEKAIEEVGKQLGADAWRRASVLWGKLRTKMEANPAAQEAAQDVANAPEDADAQAALRLQLRKLLSGDEILAAEMTRLWEVTETAGVTIIATGKRSVAAQKIEGSTIIAGDQNVVKPRTAG
jgi:hypothetical protein